MKKGDVIRQKCVNTTFYLTGILAHKVNNTNYKTSIRTTTCYLQYNKCNGLLNRFINISESSQHSLNEEEKIHLYFLFSK